MNSRAWSYKVYEVKPKSVFSGISGELLESELTRLGNQGWELIKIRTHDASSKLQLIMKRPG
ncbi:MAG: DUF4177 domain-containing protein [Pseudomonadota bacterium]